MTYGVHLIAAVGLSGQIGLRGGVPWHGRPEYAEHTARDLAEFSRLTEGGVLIMGSVTAGGIVDFKPRERKIIVWNRYMSNHRSGDLIGPAALLKNLRENMPQRNIWICGGEMIYSLFRPYVDWHHISVIPYDGAADAWMPPIIPGWVPSEREDRPFITQDGNTIKRPA